MQIALAGIFILALVALVAGPVMARRAAAVETPTIVAAVDAFDNAKGLPGDKTDPAVKLDTWIKGAIHIEGLPAKVADKWRISSVKCGDVNVVALGIAGKVMSSTVAMSDQADPAGCVYSMKVPSGIALSMFAQVGNAQSIGITSVAKVGMKGLPGSDKVIKSDIVTEKFAPPGALKGAPQSVKLRGDDKTGMLPLYIKF